MIKRMVFIGLALLFMNLKIVNLAHASVFTEIPFDFTSYAENNLDWVDSADERNTDSQELGFSVNIGGATYDHFDLNSNGYVQLLSGSQSPTNYGYGSINNLIGADNSSSYLLAAYDDLDSSYYGYYGYKLQPDKAIFYFNTETYPDGDNGLLNNYEMILSKNGDIQWNFNYADYSNYDFDLYSGLYFGNTNTLHELVSGYIPAEKSYIYSEAATVPEPATLSLLGIGLFGLLGLGRKKKN